MSLACRDSLWVGTLLAVLLVAPSWGLAHDTVQTRI